MAIPRVFVSSTFYDLRYIRENLKYFIRTIGYEPILSEDGTIFYDPVKHTQDACVSEVPNCQLFVLLIGGRFGGSYHDTSRSITNSEYREAVSAKIPVFALVEQPVWAEHHVYVKNRDNGQIDPSLIRYSAVDNVRIFDFIEEVRKNSVNNALVPFRDFADVELYLRQQWAGMMFSFLLRQNEDKRVADSLSMLQAINERIEMLSRQILTSVGTESAKVTAELYDEMLATEAIRDLSWLGLHPTPASVIRYDSLLECAEQLGKPVRVHRASYDEAEDVAADDDYSLWGDGHIGRNRLLSDEKQYRQLHERLLWILNKHGLTTEDYLREQEKAPTPNKSPMGAPSSST